MEKLSAFSSRDLLVTNIHVKTNDEFDKAGFRDPFEYSEYDFETFARNIRIIADEQNCFCDILSKTHQWEVRFFPEGSSLMTDVVARIDFTLELAPSYKSEDALLNLISRF